MDPSNRSLGATTCAESSPRIQDGGDRQGRRRPRGAEGLLRTLYSLFVRKLVRRGGMEKSILETFRRHQHQRLGAFRDRERPIDEATNFVTARSSVAIRVMRLTCGHINRLLPLRKCLPHGR
jgi:hypothetical protein